MTSRAELLKSQIMGAEIRLEAYKSNHDKEGVALERRFIRMLKIELAEIESSGGD